MRAKKSLGQNFLIDQNIVKKIIKSADLKSPDTILEIGPGKGVLTFAIAPNVKKLIAIEKDKILAEELENSLDLHPNTKIIEGDALKILKNKERILPKEYIVVANIPYNITSHLIRILLETKPRPQKMILMIQKEVAQRIQAQKDQMNLLALSVQLFAEPKILFSVSKNSFRPKPKVQSAVIEIKTKEKIPTNKQIEKIFTQAKAGFSSKRKLLASNLSNILKLPKKEIEKTFANCEIPPNSRAQELDVENWKCLAKNIK